MELPIQFDPDALVAFCQRHHLTKLAFFGSVLTDRFGPDSDVDVLFEYHPDHVPTLLDVVAMEDELSTLLGRKVDLKTAEDLSRHFRNDVVSKAYVQYAA